jgi:sensor histidine kinase regulating citrate/malate metabolism
VDEPVLSALIMGKSAEAHERGAELSVSVSGGDGLHGLAVQDLVTILGNLLDNALDAAAAAPPPRKVSLTIETAPDRVVFAVADSGPGIDPAIAGDILEYGFSTKAPASDGAAPVAGGRGVGLALVRQAVKRLHGTLSIGAADASADALDGAEGLGGALFRVVLPAPDPMKETE